MGLNCSPSLANLFLIDFDSKALDGFHIKPKLYFRYLDDIYFLFRGTPLELQDYQNYLNSLIPSINLTFTQSLTSVDFLDVTVFKCTSRNKITLQTKIFFKETDSHQLLHCLSYHPPHIFSSILYSQLLRFKRITSFKTDYDETCKILFSYLKERGYSFNSFRSMKRKVWFSGDSDKHKGIKQEQSILPLIIEYCPFGRALGRAHRATLENYPLTQNLKMICAYHTHKTLTKSLVRAKL